MYSVSEAFSSGAGAVSQAAGGAATGCCSGCGIAADMMEVLVTDVASRGAVCVSSKHQKNL